MGLDYLVKGVASLALALSLFSPGCLPETKRIMPDLIAPADFGRNPEPLSEANGFIFDLPDKIPGVAKIKRYLTRDAKCVLVHVRQRHDDPEATEIQKLEIMRVQMNIRKIIKYLHRNLGVNEVFSEGVSSETEDETNYNAVKSRMTDLKAMEFMSELEKQVISAEAGLVGKVAEEREDLEKQVRQIKQEQTRLEELYKRDLYFRNKFMALNSVFSLVYEGETWMRASESSVAHAIAIKKSKKIRRTGIATEEDVRDIFDNREDYVLGIISISGVKAAVLVYGGGHEFGGKHSFGSTYRSEKDHTSLKDNIAWWNKTNPTKKFSLVEITPESYYPK